MCVCVCGVCVCGVCASYPSIWCTDMPSFRQANTPQTDREWERGRERLTGENAVKTMQTRLSPGAEREQGARVVGAFVFRFYIQVDFIYSAKATTKKWFITLGREPRLLSWLWQADDCAPCHASLLPLTKNSNSCAWWIKLAAKTKRTTVEPSHIPIYSEKERKEKSKGL